MPAPTVTSVTPNYGHNDNDALAFSIVGTNLDGGNLAITIGGVSATDVTVDSATAAHGTIDLTGLEAGAANLVATTDGGTVTKTGFFTVWLPVPTLTGLSYDWARQGTTRSYTLTGTELVDGCVAKLVNNEKATVTTTFVSATSLTLTIIVDGDCRPGYYDITVTNPDTQIATLMAGLHVITKGDAMPEASTTRTDTTRYPVYATKGAFLADLKKIINQEACNRDRLIEILYRVSNTDTSNWEGGNGHAARGEP